MIRSRWDGLDSSLPPPLLPFCNASDDCSLIGVAKAGPFTSISLRAARFSDLFMHGRATVLTSGNTRTPEELQDLLKAEIEKTTAGGKEKDEGEIQVSSEVSPA